jgi:hypothetical protein
MQTSAAHVSHGRAAESLEAKAQWFQSLTLEERMDYLCEMTDLIVENNPRILEPRHTEPVAGRIRVLKLAEL